MKNEREERQKIALSDLLERQKKTHFLATVEPVANNEENLKVTPWRQSGGCFCEQSFVLPKNAIDAIYITGEKHPCCGKVLDVVEMEFKKDASIPVSDLVARAMREPGSSAMAHSPANIPEFRIPYPDRAFGSYGLPGMPSAKHSVGLLQRALQSLLTAAMEGSSSHSAILQHLLRGGSVPSEILGIDPANACPGPCGSCACCCDLYSCRCKFGPNCNNCYT